MASITEGAVPAPGPKKSEPPPTLLKQLEFISFGNICEFVLWAAMLGLALRANPLIAAVLANPVAVSRLVLAVAAQIGFTYTVDRYRDCTRESDQINSPARVKWFLRNERFVVVLLGASLVGGVWAVKDYADPLPWLVNFLFMGLYSFPFIFGFRVKDVPLLKTPYITVCTAMTAALVAGEAGVSIFEDGQLQLAMGYVLLCKFMNSIMNDFRDVKGDAAEGVPTLPVLIGVRNCQLLLLVVGAVAFYSAGWGLRSRALLWLPLMLALRAFTFAGAASHTPWRTNVAWNFATCIAILLLD